MTGVNMHLQRHASTQHVTAAACIDHVYDWLMTLAMGVVAVHVNDCNDCRYCVVMTFRVTWKVAEGPGGGAGVLFWQGC